jgi:hypothetical protein
MHSYLSNECSGKVFYRAGMNNEILGIIFL